MQTNRRFFIFGTNHGPCDFGVNKETGKVALLEMITGTFFLNVAKDEISFLQALTKILEFKSYYRKKNHVTGEITRRIRQECIEMAGGEEYAKFYKFIVVSVEDSPDGPFTLP